MSQHTARHLAMLESEWPLLASRLREESAKKGCDPRDLVVGLLQREDAFACYFERSAMPPLSVMVVPREDLAGLLGEPPTARYAEHVDAILTDPRPGHVHAMVFAGDEATRAQVPFP